MHSQKHLQNIYIYIYIFGHEKFNYTNSKHMHLHSLTHTHTHKHTHTQTHTHTHTHKHTPWHTQAPQGRTEENGFEKRTVFEEDLRELPEDIWQMEAGSLFHLKCFYFSSLKLESKGTAHWGSASCWCVYGSDTMDVCFQALAVWNKAVICGRKAR